MRSLFLILISLTSLSGFAAYDSGWYQTVGWSGEYPAGFSVVKRGVSVPARAAMDLDAEKKISCALPYRAVFHPWNRTRKAGYHTASRIVLLVASSDFYLGDGELVHDLVKRGEPLEYLMGGSEGIFSVRYNGKIYSADQGLFSVVEAFDETQFREDRWLNVRCLNGKSAWIYMEDIYTHEESGETGYLPGLDTWSRGLRKYGKVTDLSAKELPR